MSMVPRLGGTALLDFGFPVGVLVMRDFTHGALL